MMLLGWEIDKLQWDFSGAVPNALIHLGGEIFSIDAWKFS